MANIVDYLQWRGDVPFYGSPFNEVDNLILSMLSFVDFADIVRGEAMGIPVRLSSSYKLSRERYPNGEVFGYIIPEKTFDMYGMAAESARFSEVYAAYYVSVLEEAEVLQFAAVTFILPDNSIFISYRGTDDTLVGWREDFNLSYTYPVRAQEMALEYLETVASVYSGAIRLGGHSKGGNLAVYAALNSSPAVKERILMAYSNDGPGFLPEVVESEEFAAMSGRIMTIVPQSSVIGMLLGHAEDYTVIESTTPIGLMQHDPFTWQVMGREFVRLPSLSDKGKKHDAAFREWLRSVSPDERKKVTEIIFRILDSTGAKTVTDLSVDQWQKTMSALRTITELTKEERDMIARSLKKLFGKDA